jgi:enamine deaminase RidA (YjgF/YER057c/UK114 family)
MTHEQTGTDKLTFVNPPGPYDPAPNGYSHLACFPPGWRIILPAGQGGETEDQELSDDFATQFKQALTNVETVLKAADAAMSDVAKINLLIVDHDRERFRRASGRSTRTGATQSGSSSRARTRTRSVTEFRALLCAQPSREYDPSTPARHSNRPLATPLACQVRDNLAMSHALRRRSCLTRGGCRRNEVVRFHRAAVEVRVLLH